MDSLKAIVEKYKSSDTQVAYMYKEGDTYTKVYACDLARQIYTDFDTKWQMHEWEEDKNHMNRLQHQVRSSQCAGKLYTIGLIIGKGEELSFHCQWKDREKCSYFSRLPRHDRSKQTYSYQRMKSATFGANCPLNDCHDLAVRLLQEAINNGMRVTYTCKCQEGHHVIELFTTDSTMYAKEEVTVLNGNGKTVRLDLCIYDRTTHNLLFCVEVYNTHKTVENSRKSLLWCEVIAGRVLDTIEGCDDASRSIRVPTEPRDDVARMCARCVQEDERRMQERASELEREAALVRRQELAIECSRRHDDANPFENGGNASSTANHRKRTMRKVLFFVGNGSVWGILRNSGFGPHDCNVRIQGAVPYVIFENKKDSFAVCIATVDAQESLPNHSVSRPLSSNWLCHPMFQFYGQGYRAKIRALAQGMNRDPSDYDSNLVLDGLDLTA